MTLGNEAAVGRAVAALGPETSAQAQARAHAREASVPSALSPAPSLEPVVPPESDGESPAEQALNRAIGAFGQVDRLYRRAAHGHSLLHLDPPSVQAVWAGHRKAAARWNSPVARGLRLSYGVLHTGATIPVYVLLWATSTPAGLLVTAALLTAAHYWL